MDAEIAKAAPVGRPRAGLGDFPRYSRKIPTAPLQRNVPVLTLRPGLTLGLERLQRADDLRARLVRDDNVVDVAALRRHIGVGEVRLVVVDQLLATGVGG